MSHDSSSSAPNGSECFETTVTCQMGGLSINIQVSSRQAQGAPADCVAAVPPPAAAASVPSSANVSKDDSLKLLDTAREIGARAKRLLDGGVGGPPVPKARLPSEANTHWVVLRGKDQVSLPEAKVYTSWQRAASLVLTKGSIEPGTVFQGWVTAAEAEAYVVAAGRTWPQKLDA